MADKNGARGLAKAEKDGSEVLSGGLIGGVFRSGHFFHRMKADRRPETGQFPVCPEVEAYPLHGYTVSESVVAAHRLLHCTVKTGDPVVRIAFGSCNLKLHHGPADVNNTLEGFYRMIIIGELHESGVG